jgi:hypothetical protein
LVRKVLNLGCLVCPDTTNPLRRLLPIPDLFQPAVMAATAASAQLPDWLPALLKTRFYGACPLHAALRRNELNLFDTVAMRKICQHCQPSKEAIAAAASGLDGGAEEAAPPALLHISVCYLFSFHPLGEGDGASTSLLVPFPLLPWQCPCRAVHSPSRSSPLFCETPHSRLLCNPSTSRSDTCTMTSCCFVKPRRGSTLPTSRPT